MYRVGKEELAEVKKVIDAGKMFMFGDPASGHQQEVARFEREWAEKIGVKHALCVTSGTGALLCSLAALGIGPGDEVIVPSYTFMASAASVLMMGAIPVICDVDETCLMDPEDVERKMGPNVKAIIPVHMVGMPCDMDRIMTIAEKHDVKVIEDSCQCDGGSYKGKRTGSIGHVGAFSFNDYKILSSGEGGAFATNDENLYQRAMIFGDSGASFRAYAKDLTIAPFVGMQLRQTEVHAAILRIQLTRLEGILADLRRIKARIMKELDGAPGIRFIPSNDIEGDCGVVAAFSFDTVEQAIDFAKAEGVGGYRPGVMEKHVYSMWGPILEKRVGHHPDMNPYNNPKNRGLRMDVTRDMLPKSLDILKRTVFVNLHTDWTDEEVAKRIAAFAKAGEQVSATPEPMR